MSRGVVLRFITAGGGREQYSRRLSKMKLRSGEGGAACVVWARAT